MLTPDNIPAETFGLRLLPDEALVKFDRQLPISNWSYPLNREEDLCQNRYTPYLISSVPKVSRRAIYIHIPFCQTICNFCPFRRDKYESESSEIQEYLEALTAEMELKRRYIGRPAVDTIFVGGGTPSLLTPSQIRHLGNNISRNFDLKAGAQFTFEIEVKSISREKIQAMREIGVTRVSFGAQTLLGEYRRLFGLDATKKQIMDAAEWVNAAFAYTNVDLLYGFPGETFDQVGADFAAITGLGTTTIDVYPINNLSAQPSMHQAVARAGLEFLPATTRLRFRIYLDQLFREHGYASISGYSYARADCSQAGVSNVVQHLPKTLYHDLFYGYDSDEIIGYGSSALSSHAWFNLYNFPNRQAYVREVLVNRALPHNSFGPIAAPEKGIVTFPYRGVLDKSRIVWNSVPEETLARLSEASNAGLIIDRGETYEVTKLGWLFYVNLMYYFMPGFGKSWISQKMAYQNRGGRNCGDTALTELFGTQNEWALPSHEIAMAGIRHSHDPGSFRV